MAITNTTHQYQKAIDLLIRLLQMENQAVGGGGFTNKRARMRAREKHVTVQFRSIHN